jgi:hypothetical protein
MITATMTKKEIEETIIAKASQDSKFKEELISNPKLAFSREGISLPDRINVNVIEESATNYYLVLPAPISNSEELSEAELESIAGGWKITITIEK